MTFLGYYEGEGVISMQGVSRWLIGVRAYLLRRHARSVAATLFEFLAQRLTFKL